MLACSQMLAKTIRYPYDYCIICSYDITGIGFKNSLYVFGQSKKSQSSMYNNLVYSLLKTVSVNAPKVYLKLSVQLHKLLNYLDWNLGIVQIDDED